MIEQRISDAIADVRMQLALGNKNPDLIEQVASNYDLKPTVLAFRIAKAFRSLEAMEAQDKKSATMRAIEARMKQAIYDYTNTDAGIDIEQWLENRAGRKPNFEEIQLADQLWMENELRRLMAGGGE